MGKIANSMINGEMCSLCGCYFEKDGKIYEHGFPVICWDCWEDLEPETKMGSTKAEVNTL